MKNFYLLLSALMVPALCDAQTYKLTDMSQEAFAAGGDAQWSFQKYEYGTGQYTAYAQYTDKSTANFLDYYNPERCMGNRIYEIDGYTGTTNQNLWPAELRYAWCDSLYEDVNNANSFGKFAYVARAFGNEIETYANSKFAGVVSFTVPEDGYYTVAGSVARQDCPSMKGLSIVPRYRYSGATQVDNAVTMGLSFEYGINGGQIDGYSNNLVTQGGQQRWLSQQAYPYTMAFYAKKGDVVSFEANAYVNFSSATYARDCYGRTFFKQLDITKTDEAAAKATSNFVNPYDEAAVKELQASLQGYFDRIEVIESDSMGTDYGQYKEESVLAAYEVLNAIQEGVTTGAVNAMNAPMYKDKLTTAWNTLMLSRYTFDYSAKGNYILYTDNEDLADKKVDFTKNEDNPFGYYSYTPSTGAYAKLPNYGKTKGGSDGWYNKANDWFYIQADATMHPLANQAPAVMFTAPEDGYYKVEINLYRTSPNVKVENPLYLRNRFVTQDGETLTCAKDVEISSKQYGSVANDGQQGKAPIEMNFLVNMKKGDKISSEVDAYTSNKNSSAGTTFTRYVVAGYLSEGQKIDDQYVAICGLDLYDPYKAADMTELKAVVDSANTIAKAANVGDDEGQYPTDNYNTFKEAIAAAEAYTTSTETYGQGVIDQAVLDLNSAITAFLAARTPYTVTLPQTLNLRVAGTQKRLTQKNAASNGTYFYADFCAYADVVADTVRNNTLMSQYSWLFKAIANEAGGYNLTNDNGIVTKDAYVSIYSTDEATIADSRLLIVKENAEDSLVAVKRLSDGKYWTAKIEWKSPYNRVATSDAAQYLFVIDAEGGEVTAVRGITDKGNGAAVKVELFNVNGMRTNAVTKGLIIRRTTYADGTVKTDKIIVK